MRSYEPWLEEWIAWGRRLNTPRLYWRSDFKDEAARLSESTVKELAEFYDRAIREEHLSKINGWLQSIHGSAPMSGDERAVRNLVLLFPHIGRYWGMRPFNSNALTGGCLVPPIPDWSKLPVGFGFVSEGAEIVRAYPQIDIEGGKEASEAIVSIGEIARLRVIGEQLRSAGFKKIQSWYLGLGVIEHVEALLVSRLISLLDMLGIIYYE